MNWRAFGLAICLGSPAAAAPPSASLPTSTPTLPTMTLELVAEGEHPANAPYRVGDTVEVRPSGGSGLVAEEPEGTSTLKGAGFRLLPASEGPSRLLILKPGELKLPPLPLKDSAGQRVGQTEAKTLTAISSIAPDDPKPAEPVSAAGPLRLGFPWWVVVLGVIGLLILGAGLFVVSKRLIVAWLRRRRERRPPPPPIPPHEIARRALSELKANAWIEQKKFKPAYFRMSEILKAYLGARFKFDAEESTSREILQILSTGALAGQIPDRLFVALEGMSEALDWVKFTDWTPTVETAQQLFAALEQWISDLESAGAVSSGEVHASR